MVPMIMGQYVNGINPDKVEMELGRKKPEW